ncbi:hypothetical protein ACOSQ3_026107 [Xanthoceras sorbifolium]
MKANYNATVKGDNLAVLCSWYHPLEGWIKLNVDGGRSSDLGIITASDVLRDHNGNWRGGFAARIAIGSILEPELWGLLKGLKAAWDRGFRRVMVETDSMAVVEVLKKRAAANHPVFGLLNQCHNLLNDENWRCNLVHIFRECNRVADMLSNMGKDMDLGLCFFEEPPQMVMKSFLGDIEGVAVIRHKMPLV